MKSIAYLRWADPPLWKATLANFLPLWLLCFIILPYPVFPVLDRFPGIWLLLFLALIIFLLWLRWFTAELILYSFSPLTMVFIFEEVSASYKIPFLLLCMILLSFGIFGYRLSLQKGALGLGWLTLLIVFIGTWMLASHANQNYWQMVSDLGFTCAPDTLGCATFTGNETPWWVLFFRFTI